MEKHQELLALIKKLLISDFDYHKYQRERIFYTIGLLRKFEFIKDVRSVLMLGRGEPSFDRLFELSLPDAEFSYTQGNLENGINYGNNLFDLAICTEVYEHISDCPYREGCDSFAGVVRLTMEIARVLKPRGYCLLTTPNITGYCSIFICSPAARLLCGHFITGSIRPMK